MGWKVDCGICLEAESLHVKQAAFTQILCLFVVVYGADSS